MIVSRSINCYRFILPVIAILICAVANADETMPKFPAWMNEAGHESTGKQGINEPSMPIDPATGQPATEQSRSKNFKPQLPDFKKMREKAIKVEMEKKSNDISSLEKSYSISVKNLEQLKSNKTELERLLAASPGPNDQLQLLDGLKTLDNKIRLSQELLSIIGGDTASGTPGQTIASLTAEQFGRAMALQKQLFSSGPKTAGEIKVPVRPTPPEALSSHTTEQTSESDEEVEARAAKLRHRPYRPGRIKSFYIESKEAQKKADEEADDE